MVEEGIVSAKRGTKLTIDITRHPACSSCRACSKSEGRLMRVEAEASINAGVGDKVYLRLDDNIILKGIIITYIIPLLFLSLGIFIGSFVNELASAGCGITLLILSFFAIKKFGLINKERFKPTVIARRPKADEAI